MVLVVEYKDINQNDHALKEFITQKVMSSTKDLLPENFSVKIFLSKKNINFITKIVCLKGKFSFHSYSFSHDIYSSISIATNRLRRQLLKYKNILTQNKFSLIKKRKTFNIFNSHSDIYETEIIANDCF